MNAYKVQSVVKNGQVVVDLPEGLGLNDTLVEVIIFQIQLPDTFDNPNKKPKGLSKYDSVLNSEMPVENSDDLTKFWRENEAFEKEFANNPLPPRQPMDLTLLRGAGEGTMTIEEIDSLTKSWRDEWERDIY